MLVCKLVYEQKILVTAKKFYLTAAGTKKSHGRVPVGYTNRGQDFFLSIKTIAKMLSVARIMARMISIPVIFASA